jgi:hypothetical protein
MESEERIFERVKKCEKLIDFIFRSFSADIPIVAVPQEKSKPKAYQDPNLDPQTKVILEFIETEEDYVNDLQTIIDVLKNQTTLF